MTTRQNLKRALASLKKSVIADDPIILAAVHKLEEEIRKHPPQIRQNNNSEDNDSEAENLIDYWNSKY